VIARALVDRIVAGRLRVNRARAVAVCGVPDGPAVEGFFTGLGVPLRAVYRPAESFGVGAIRAFPT
jgi:hypothetical protein